MNSLFGKTIGITTSEARGVAAWLIEKTALTFEQIADFLGIARIEVKLIADEEMLPRPKPTDPVRLGWLDPDDLCRSEKHTERRLSKPWAWASDKLSKPSSASLRDSPISVSYTHLTLPTNREV